MAEIANLVRREIIDTAKIVVVKVGTNVLSKDDDTLDIERIEALAEQIHRLRETGRQVVLVLVLGGLFFKELDTLLQLANVQCSRMAAGARRH